MAIRDGEDVLKHADTPKGAPLVGVALASALLGQYSFIGPPRHIWSGVLLYVVAGAAF